jgi:hypothetical protein
VITKERNFTLCIDCEPDRFPISLEACVLCPSGGICRGANDIGIKPGYWREDNESIYILSCEKLPANCIGGDLYGNNLCYEGHMGPLCEECDI